ncbi:MAG: hypothetical protein FIB08_08750 [Candidatus Methanoperedens sp.]|nr:hypothetical protein [Candidatus Methanoperedens sp.]
MDKKSISVGLPSVSIPWRIVGMLILISALGGCVGKESKQGVELPVQNISDKNPVEEVSMQSTANMSDSNQIRLRLLSKEFNSTGRLSVQLQVKNPRLNETVLTVFKPQIGQEWTDITEIIQTVNNTWTQNYTIQPKGNVSYVWMYIQISENNTAVKRAAWNITFEVPVGRPT